MSYLKIDARMTPQEKRQQHYREEFKRINPSWDDTMIIFHRLFGSVVKSGSSLLDLGCGRGNVIIDDYRSMLKEAIGIDADHEAVKGNESLDRIEIGNVERLPFPDQSMDIVISQWVIEHLEHPEIVFAECYRVLRCGGVFLFVTPYAYSSVLLIKRLFGSSLTKKILKFMYGREEQDCFETMYRANTTSDLQKLLKSAGFVEEALISNVDPSYWAFNRFCFSISSFFARVFPRASVMHFVGVYRKS